MNKDNRPRKEPYTLYLLMDDEKGNQRPSNHAVKKGHFSGLKEVKRWIEGDGGNGIWRCDLDFNVLAQTLREKVNRTQWHLKPTIDIPCFAVGETIDENATTGIYWLMREPDADLN